MNEHRRTMVADNSKMMLLQQIAAAVAVAAAVITIIVIVVAIAIALVKQIAMKTMKI